MNIASRLKDLLKCWQIRVNYRPTGLGQIMWLCFTNMVFTKQQNVLLFLFDLCIPYWLLFTVGNQWHFTGITLKSQRNSTGISEKFRWYSNRIPEKYSTEISVKFHCNSSGKTLEFQWNSAGIHWDNTGISVELYRNFSGIPQKFHRNFTEIPLIIFSRENTTNTTAKRSALSQQVTTRLQGTDPTHTNMKHN